MPQESYIREKFTREHDAARRLARLYFEKFPKDLYLTEIESWRHLQSQNYEFIFKRLREPIGDQQTKRNPLVKFAEPRPYAQPEAAMMKLLEIASTVEPVQLFVRRPIRCA